MLDSARRLGLAAMLFAAGGGTGCATWVNGRTQEVRVVTDPPGAAVTRNGQPVGLTPATLVVPRRGRAELAFAKEGHESATLAIPREGSWWLWGNAWVWNPLAAQGMPSTSAWLASVSGWFAALMAVDLLSGGAFVRPRVLAISLVPVRDFTGIGTRLPGVFVSGAVEPRLVASRTSRGLLVSFDLASPRTDDLGPRLDSGLETQVTYTLALREAGRPWRDDPARTARVTVTARRVNDAAGGPPAWRLARRLEGQVLVAGVLADRAGALAWLTGFADVEAFVAPAPPGDASFVLSVTAEVDGGGKSRIRSRDLAATSVAPWR